MRRVKWIACLVLAGLVAGSMLVQHAGSQPDEKKKKDVKEKKVDEKPPVHRVQKKPFKIERTLKGILSPAEAVEISYRPIVQPSGRGELTIRSIVDHGTQVKAGDVIVAFDATRLEETIDALEVEQKGLKADIKLAEEELPVLEKSAPVELAAAENARRMADDGLNYFLKTDKAEKEKSANFYVKSAKFYKEYAEEELRQLEKMYKANDLTEETEKIILRRQKNWVEMANYFYESSVIDRDHTLKQVLPDYEKSLRETLVKQTLAVEKLKKTQGPGLEQKRLALAKLRHNVAKNDDRLAKLTKDRAALTVRAPHDGILYYGKFHHGQWTLSESQSNRLVVHGNVNMEETLMTLVKTRPTAVRLTVDEKDAHWFKAGLQGSGRMTFGPDRKVPAKVTSMAPVPASPGHFAVQVALELGDAEFVPGMACSVKFSLYAKKDAIAVPADCVLEEDDKHVVYVRGPQGKEIRREVTCGQRDGERIEIVTGLKEQEEVLLERGTKTSSAKGDAQ